MCNFSTFLGDDLPPPIKNGVLHTRQGIWMQLDDVSPHWQFKSGPI